MTQEKGSRYDRDTRALQDEIERLKGELHSVHAHLNHMRKHAWRVEADGLRAALERIVAAKRDSGEMLDALDAARALLADG